MATKLKTAALALVGLGTLTTAMPAFAHDRDRGDRYEQRYDRGGDYYGRSGYNGYDNFNGGDYRNYDNRYRNQRTWRGNDGRYYCRRSDGTTGLIVGGAAGALLGSEVAGRRGDRTLGAILGAGIGALVGREVDRGGSRCR